MVGDRSPRADSPRPIEGRLSAITSRDLWALLNRPRNVDHHAVRIASLVLLVSYGIIAVLRFDPRHPEFVPLRLSVCALAFVGTVSARNFTWNRLRAFSVALALLLPLTTAYIGGTLGNGLDQLPLTALALFISVAFLQTGADIVGVALALLAGNAVLLAVLPTPEVPLLTLGIVFGSSAVAGATIALTVRMYRARIDQSTSWWQEACARERTLREFAELTAAEIGGVGRLDPLAAYFLAAFGAGGRCVLVLGRAPEGEFRIVGTAGVPDEEAARLEALPLAPAMSRSLWALVENGRPVVHERLTDAQRARLGRDTAQPVTARCLVALPITVGEVVAGAVVLTAPEPRTIGADALLLWQAMANQTGVALANAQLLGHLRHALSAKSEFLNTMSHELRSPLHVVIGYADMLREGDAGLDTAQVASRIRTSAVELLHLVENTMNAARLESGRLQLHVEEFVVQDLVRELAECIEALPEAKGGVPVGWSVAPALPPARLDRLKVKEIVQNLVSNALKFTPAGRVAVGVDVDGPRLRIAVRDTGPGIPPEAQQRIFEMFERVEQPDGRCAAGVGLGLYIVKRLAELMDGQVEVESAAGGGTCFTVHLPLHLAVTVAA